MKPYLVACCVAVVAGGAVPSADARALTVDAGFGYRTWTRGDTSISRSFVSIVPAYESGRWRLAAPVQVAFRGSDGPFSLANPLAFKSDDWVNLDLDLEYALGRTRITFQHDSLQLLSSGRLPERGFGDVETDNRLLAHRTLSAVAGSRLNAVAGYWGMDRWTDTDHGRCRGPVLGVEIDPTAKADGWAPRAILLMGREGGYSFGTAALGVQYRRGAWQVDATLESRRFHDGGQSFFSKNERRWTLALTKSLR